MCVYALNRPNWRNHWRLFEYSLGQSLTCRESVSVSAALGEAGSNSDRLLLQLPFCRLVYLLLRPNFCLARTGKLASVCHLSSVSAAAQVLALLFSVPPATLDTIF